MAGVSDNSLRIGDYISLRYSKLNAFMSSDGVLVDDVGVSSNLHQFENHVFQIVIQMQYSANNEYEEFLDSYPGDINDIEDFGIKQHFMALVRGKNNEFKMNENFMKVKTGNKVLFGDVVQLLHVKSKKFITIDGGQVARDERENLTVKLDASGNTKSWVQLMPRYKIDREGDKINNNSEILLKVLERTGEYIHCADKDPPLRKLREINSSLDSMTPWRISLFKRCFEIADTSLLLTGDLIYLRDPETNTLLMPIIHPVSLNRNRKSFDVAGDAASSSLQNHKEEAAGSGSEDEDAENEEVEEEEEDDDKSVSSVDEFIQENGMVTLTPIVNEHYDSNAIWVLESKLLTKGGSLPFRSELVHLRHLNSGKYLSTINPENISSDSIYLTLEENPSDKTGLFSVMENGFSEKDYLSNSKPVQIKQGGHLHLERGANFNDRLKVFVCSMSRMKSKATNLIISRYEPLVEALKTVNNISEVYVGKSMMTLFAKYLAMTDVPPVNKKVKTVTVWPEASVSDRNLFLYIMQRMIFYIKGFPLNYDPDTMSNLVPNNASCKRRQCIFREQGLLTQLLYMLKFLEPVSQRAIARVDDSNANESAFLDMGKELITETLKLLFEMIKGNTRNQMEVADFMLVILTHVSTDPLAAVVAQEMLSTNRDLQETKIGFKEIGNFAEKMRDSPMSSMYFNLLQSSCSCDSQGIPRNQQSIFEVVYGNYSDLVLKLKIDIDKPPMLCEWAPGSCNYFPDEKSDAQMKGENLYYTGMPSLFLDWELYDNPQSARVKVPELLYENPIDIVDTFRYMRGKAFDSRALMNYKKMVPEYFVAQISLASEMCLGRNYTVMLKFEIIYPYDCLVAIMKMSDLHDQIKGAAARLVTNLYIDRDPQNMIILPRLTRTWTEVAQTTDEQMVVSVDKTRVYTFGLLQSLISEHLVSIKGEPFTEYSFAFMQLLLKLVQFNFYGSIDRLRDILDPIILALQRDEVKDLESLQMQSSFSFKSLKKSSKKKAKDKKTVKVKEVEEEGDNEEGGVNVKVVADVNKEIVIAEKGDEIKEGVPFDPKTYLDALETLNYVFLIFSLCLVSIAVAIKAVVSNIEIWDTQWMWILQLVIFILCAVDVICRMVLTTMVKKRLTYFFIDVGNLLDIIVVILDIIYFIEQDRLGAQYMFTKVLRSLRVIALIKNKTSFTELGEVVVSTLSAKPWEEPLRFTKTSSNSLAVMEKMVEVISAIQLNIDDRNISLMLNHFYKLDEKGNEFTSEEVVETFKAIFESDNILRVSNENFDKIYIDLLMYADVALVQRVLDVLMVHHSSRRLLITNFSNLQLLVSSRSEAKFVKLEKVVMQLKHSSETHAIWGKLSDDDDRAVSQKMLKNIGELIDSSRKRRQVLKFDEDYEPENIIQDVLRNLGCFELCIKIISLISSIDKKVISESNQNTLKLAASCSELLYWFILDNPTNQFLAYEKIELFMKIIDERINSHKIIKAIFSNNELLIKSVPKQYIADFVNLIVNVGRFPQYLSLLSSVTCAGEKNIKNNQYEVIRNISFPGNQKKILLFFCPTTHEAYGKKAKEMAKHLNKKDPSIDDCAVDLQYHLELLTVLSRCSIGVQGMTTIEAKVQSMFFFVDVINAILDPQCFLLAKIKLGMFMYHSMIEVEMKLPSLKDAAVVWKFIESTIDIFEYGRDELRQIEKNGWEATTSNRQKIEYMIICAMNISGYFRYYFDSTVFRSEVVQAAVGVTRVHIREQQANNLMKNVYDKVRLIYEMRSPLLAKEHHDVLFQCLLSINDAATLKIVSNVDNLHDGLFLDRKADGPNDRVVSEHKRFNSFIDLLLNNEEITQSADDQIQDFIKTLESFPWKQENPSGPVCFEALMERLFTHIRSCIKIIVHGDESIKHMDDRSIKTTFWLLKVFRTMIENKWGMTIYQRDDDGGEEQDEASAQIVNCFTECGAVETCLDLIARGIDQKLQAEATKLIVGMLFHEGGALNVQMTINKHLIKPDSDLFFHHVRFLIQSSISWHKWNGVIVTGPGDEVNLPDDIILIRCLQLMAEGHFEPNQHLMRSQPQNLTNVNLLDDMVNYLQVLDSIKCRTSTQAALQVSALVLEMIQGPCRENQEYFATKTELIETLNRKMRHRPVHDCVQSEETELKCVVIDILQALMEGQAKRTTVYERILSVIHLDVLQLLCKPAEKIEASTTAVDESSIELLDGGDEKVNAEAAEEEEDDGAVTLQTQSLVVLQMLCDYKPSLRNELGVDMDISSFIADGNVVCCEVVWHGELQRKFIHVPDICSDLAKSTKDEFILNVDRSSPENKIYGLLSAAQDFYKEIKHQQVLKSLNVSSVFSRTNLVYADYFNFLLIFIINLLFLIYYKVNFIPCPPNNKSAADNSVLYDSALACVEKNVYSYDSAVSYDATTGLCSGCSELYLDAQVGKAVLGLTLLVIIVQVYKILIYFVVRVPVNFQVHIEKNSFWMSVLLSALDFKVLYYVIYLALAIYGIFSHIILTFLLLDMISKSTLVQGVLNAVYKPKKTIAMTIVLLCIIVYIYAMYAFSVYDDSENFAPLPGTNLDSLYNMFKEFLMHGSPAGAVATLVVTIKEWRYVGDVMFFSLMFIMWNIIKGITIDTFVEIRTDYEIKIADTEGKCYICGIEKLTFNRAISREAFDLHIKEDHNLWNYVYFIIFIWEQDKDDDDGLETYVRQCINSRDLAWFPMNKAIRLSEKVSRSDSDSLLYKVNVDLTSLNTKFDNRMEGLRDNLARSVSRVEYSMNAENQTQSYNATRRAKIGSSTANSSLYSAPTSAIPPEPGLRLVNAPRETSYAISLLEIKGVILPTDLLRRLTCRVSSTTGSEFLIFPIKIDKNDASDEQFKQAHKPFIDSKVSNKKVSSVDSLVLSEQGANVFFDPISEPFVVYRTLAPATEHKGFIRIQIVSSRHSILASDSAAGASDEEKIALFVASAFIPINDIVSSSTSIEPFSVKFSQHSTIVPELLNDCTLSLRAFLV